MTLESYALRSAMTCIICMYVNCRAPADDDGEIDGANVRRKQPTVVDKTKDSDGDGIPDYLDDDDDNDGIPDDEDMDDDGDGIIDLKDLVRIMFPQFYIYTHHLDMHYKRVYYVRHVWM